MSVNLVIFTNKRYHHDFRKYLMRAAQRSGGTVLHVCFLDRIILSWGDAERVERPTSSNSYALEQMIRVHLKAGPTIGLTGMGGTRLDDAGVNFAWNLHQGLSDVHWVYDIYDDLLFAAQSTDRVRRLLADAAWRCGCEHSIVLDPGLRGRYPSAAHLDNASHLELLPWVTTLDPRRMVYIGSIDLRVDFDWLDALAANDVTIEIFGSVHNVAAAETQHQFNALLQRRRNVSFHGPYENDDLPTILSQFRVGLLPYRVGHPMTDHVNPDKLHHYLNTGLDVVAAPIPAARRLRRYLNLIMTDGDWEGLLEELGTSRPDQDWPRELNTWDRRWAELVNLVLHDHALTGTPQVDRRAGAA